MTRPHQTAGERLGCPVGKEAGALLLPSIGERLISSERQEIFDLFILFFTCRVAQEIDLAIDWAGLQKKGRELVPVA